jgi:uncharacterized protein (TIGR02266 family)
MESVKINKNKEKKIDLNHLEKREWELWTVTLLVILALSSFILIRHIWEISDSGREWFKELMSAETYLTTSTFLIFLVLIFCLYVVSKTMELRKLRKKLFLQKVEPEQISSTLEEVAAFKQISSMIIAKQNLETILENISRESLKCLKADRASIYRVDGEKKYLIRQNTYASTSLNEKVNLSEEKEEARKAILRNRPSLLGKPEDFANFFKYAEREGKITSLINFPILAKGKPVGVLSVARINQQCNFNEDDFKRLSVFSNYASIAIENGNLLEELSRGKNYQENYEKYCGNILQLLQDLTEEGRKEIEGYGKNLWSLDGEQGGIKVTPMSKLTIEQRRNERVEEILKVEFENDLLAETANISEGGVFIRAQDPLELGEEFLLKLYIPDEQDPINTLCKVVWVNKYGKETEELPRGMGVKFLELTAEDKRRIEEFISVQKNKKLSLEKDALPSSQT